MEYPIKKISLSHPNYPDLLKQIYNPPKELYIQGKLKKQENLPLAIVGTRQASSFGKNLAKNFAYSLGKKGFTIISGLALGIDGAAHQGALLAGAKTIAVLGSGLKHIYPPSHKKLAKKIAEILKVPNYIFIIDIFTQLADSALLDVNKDQDINASHHSKPNLPASFVPNRNAIFFAIAHAYAQKQGLEHIITGINQTDYSGYPDCREPFVKSLEMSLNMGSESNIVFKYPLIDLTKAETFKMAKDEGVLDLVIEESHTCYNGDRSLKHDWGYGCGNCPACVLRKKGWNEYSWL